MSVDQRTKQEIFQQGSRTYYHSSLFFPKPIRERVFRLYAFVRVVDDYVDAIPQQMEAFYQARQRYDQALAGKRTGDHVIDSFVDLMEECSFEKEWVDAFWRAMGQDLHKQVYHTEKELLDYIYGSAEVVGLMMAAVMEIDRTGYESAKMLGRSMQFINFIRDVVEDIELGRTYLPREYWEAFGLKELSLVEAKRKPVAFGKFIRQQVKRYHQWRKQGEAGFSFIPRRCLIPIRTASQMYAWTAEQIASQPHVIFSRQIKPRKWRIFSSILFSSGRVLLPVG